MATALAASLLDAVLGLELGALEQEASNRFTLDGLAFGQRRDGALEIAARRLEASSLRLARGPLVVEVGRLAVHKVLAQVRTDGGRPRLRALDAGSAELAGVKVHGPLMLPGKGTAGPAEASTWCLGPLGAAEGTMRAKIVDAHLLFDADVTVPIRQGVVNFNDATVEHVGPDSRMGVSRLGIYVDAPNGRSYLAQFPSTPVGGVEYERRGAFLGAMVSDRGKLRLQEFVEGLLRQGRIAQGLDLTQQARLLFDRTALSGQVQLGDGTFAAPGLRAELEGRAEGRNAVRLHAEAVGRGISAELPSLSVREAAFTALGLQLACRQLTASLTLRLAIERAQLRFALELANVTLTGLHFDPGRAAGA